MKESEIELRSRIMRAIKSENTKVEVLLRKVLWNRGYRYRKNDKAIYGTPDVCFRRYKIAIFVDSEFFHGYNWEEKKQRLKSNREYWIAKIERNIDRDTRVNDFLKLRGWRVLRFWDRDVKKNLWSCVITIEREVDNVKSLLNY